MEENQKSVGSIFGSINYTSIEHLELFLLNLNLEQSLYILNQSLEYANNRGSFSLQESEFISKALRILNKEVYSKDDSKTDD